MVNFGTNTALTSEELDRVIRYFFVEKAAFEIPVGRNRTNGAEPDLPTGSFQTVARVLGDLLRPPVTGRQIGFGFPFLPIERVDPHRENGAVLPKILITPRGGTIRNGEGIARMRGRGPVDATVQLYGRVHAKAHPDIETGSRTE